MHPLLNKVKNAPNIEHELHTSTLKDKQYLCKIISFVNPYSYTLLRSDSAFYKNVDHYYSDGILSCMIFSILFRDKIPRISFDHSSFAKTFFNFAEKNNLSIFIIGSKEEQLIGAIEQFTTEYPQLNICGSQNGYFKDDLKVIEKIKKSGAKYIICGLGTPKQDLFSQKLKEALPHQIKQIYTCGGFLHQSENTVNYYPKYINKLNLRWLYRAINEPGVAKRLLTKYPLFGVYVLLDRMKRKS